MSNKDAKKLFNKEFKDIQQKLLRHVGFRVFNPAIANEIVQETFMKMWKYIKSGKKIDKPKALLYTMAVNSVIDYHRKRKRRQSGSLEKMEEAGWQIKDPDAEKNVEDDIEFMMLSEELAKALEKLNPNDKHLIALRYRDQLMPKEIAKKINISPNTVSVRLNRAINRLRKIIKEMRQEEESQKSQNQ